MYNIESYTIGTLQKLSLSLFERRMKIDKRFRRKVNLYKNIDSIMQGALMASAAEQEMVEKNIDLVTAGFVNDFLSKKQGSRKIKDFLSWS